MVVHPNRPVPGPAGERVGGVHSPARASPTSVSPLFRLALASPFPDASTADIRSFLTLFADCFGIRRKHRLAFRPDDRIMDIYRALYPPQCSIADAMDMDDLAAEMEGTYGLHLDEVWHENMSLGELFDNARSARRPALSVSFIDHLLLAGHMPPQRHAKVDVEWSGDRD